MSAFRTVLPRNRDDVAKSLADIVGGGGDALIVGGGTLTVPALVRGDITATHVSTSAKRISTASNSARRQPKSARR